MGYVYLIKDIDKNVYKIGVTRKKDSRRLKQLQTGNSGELELINIFETKYPFRLEQMLHKHFEGSHLHGELFTIEKPEDFESICKIYQNRIESLLDNPYFNINLR